jgi:hypothetical protein
VPDGFQIVFSAVLLTKTANFNTIGLELDAPGFGGAAYGRVYHEKMPKLRHHA